MTKYRKLNKEIINKYKNIDGYKINRKFNIDKCENCGVCFTNPFLSSNEYSKYHELHQVAFNGAGNEETIDEYIKNKEVQWLKLGYVHRLERILSIKSDVKKLLDVGCGAGLYLDYLKSKGYSVEGIELSPWGYNIAKNKLGLKVHNDLIENLEPPRDKFDVITLYDVLEHTTNPNKFLQELKKWLKKDGMVMFNVPNIDSAISKSTKELWNKLCPPDHTFHFNAKSVSYLLNKNGYYPFSISTNNGELGESLGQFTIGVWHMIGEHSRPVAIALKILNKPFSKNEGALLILIKGSRKVANSAGFLLKPFMKSLNNKGKGEGLSVACRLYQ